MHIPTLAEIVALVLMGVLIAAVLHAGLYNKHRRRVRGAVALQDAHPEPPKKGERVRLLCGIPELRLPIGSEGRITHVDASSGETIYFMDFGGGITSVMFYDYEAWRFEVIR